MVFNGEWWVRRTLTYAELYDLVARLARAFKALWAWPPATAWQASCPTYPRL